MKPTVLAALAALVLSTPAATHALSRTQSAVQENVPGRANANRHRLHIQSTGRSAGLLVASCRVEDPDTIGVALLLGEGRVRTGAQRVAITRETGERRVAELVPSEDFLTLAGAGAAETLGWALEGGSVRFRHDDGVEAAFDLGAARADIARFRQLCRF